MSVNLVMSSLITFSLASVMGNLGQCDKDQFGNYLRTWKSHLMGDRLQYRMEKGLIYSCTSFYGICCEKRKRNKRGLFILYMLELCLLLHALIKNKSWLISAKSATFIQMKMVNSMLGLWISKKMIFKKSYPN